MNSKFVKGNRNWKKHKCKDLESNSTNCSYMDKIACLHCEDTRRSTGYKLLRTESCAVGITYPEAGVRGWRNQYYPL